MKEKLIINHPVLLPCTTKCKNQCLKKIDEPRRQQLNEEYWTMSYSERHLFIKGSIESTPIKRRTIAADPDNSKPNRNISNIFVLKDQNGFSTSVCRTFFLATLGYTKANNTVL